MGLPMVALGLSAAGTAVGAIGQISQGEAQAAEARYQAAVAQNNAVIAAQNRQYALQAGAENVTATGLRERAAGGRVTAQLASEGLDVNTGSARQVREGQRRLGMLSELTAAQQGELAAYGYRSQQVGFQAESQLLKAEAPMDVTAGFLGADATLLSGASNLPFKWNALQNPTPGTAMGTFPGGGTAF